MLTIGLVLPDGFANFSFAPLAVFEAANVIFGEPLYKVHIVSIGGGTLKKSFGMTVETERAEDLALDTLLVGGVPDNSKCSGGPAPHHDLIAEHLNVFNLPAQIGHGRAHALKHVGELVAR